MAVVPANLQLAAKPPDAAGAPPPPTALADTTAHHDTMAAAAPAAPPAQAVPPDSTTVTIIDGKTGAKQDVVVPSPANAAATANAAPAAIPAAASRQAVAGYTLRQALASHHYWLIFAAFVLIAMATYGVTLNLVPLLRAQGHSAAVAAAAEALS